MQNKKRSSLRELINKSEICIEDLKTYLRQMLEIRFFEEKVFELLSRNIIKGASHLYARLVLSQLSERMIT